MNKQYKIKISKMNNQSEFMKRIFKLSVWLKKRYKLNYKDCDFDYSMIKDNKVF